ncbi:hypothetical protein A6E00_08550 [Vibrio diabolicus]|uniref:Uncharacterized protein n=1 Tax=Vibrio sp. FF_273 TaxID=1652830 RepID=A0A0H4A4Q4_9VIBR|nr:hypothetical protein [Vibrio diabolicus]AKN40866.1 hypothetical protein [Vibrio sp. FF_273]OCH69553.1 hypothetical protein A6E00_08550 [Vibrio diabolicus]
MSSLAQITKELTLEELHELREEILSLSEALKAVPSEYDASFQQKMNRVLDITSEVEHHTRQLRNGIEQAQKASHASLNREIRDIIQQHHIDNQQMIARTISGYIPVNKGLFFASIIAATLIGGGIMGTVFYWLALR